MTLLMSATASQTTVEDVCILNQSLPPNEVAVISAAGEIGVYGQPALSIRSTEVEVAGNSISNGTCRVDYESALTSNAWTPLVG